MEHHRAVDACALQATLEKADEVAPARAIELCREATYDPFEDVAFLQTAEATISPKSDATISPEPTGLCRVATYDPYENDADVKLLAAKLCRVATFDPYEDVAGLCRVATYDPYEDGEMQHCAVWPPNPQQPTILMPVDPCLVRHSADGPGCSPAELQRTLTYDPYEDGGVWPGDAWGCSSTIKAPMLQTAKIGDGCTGPPLGGQSWGFSASIKPPALETAEIGDGNTGRRWAPVAEENSRHVGAALGPPCRRRWVDIEAAQTVLQRWVEIEERYGEAADPFLVRSVS